MFRIKICGVVEPEDARMVAESGADALGLNFYSRSVRCVTAADAKAIAAAAEGVIKVGLFVNEQPQMIRGIAEFVGLDCLQLHGDESLELLELLSPWPVIKAFRVELSNREQVRESARDWLDRGAAGILIDAAQRPGEYGGGGEPADWLVAAELVESLNGPVILAGGLNPENIELAIEAVRPYGVDTASGVESAPGRKDRVACCRFAAAAKRGLELEL
ncbi:MAG: phosphoribosylanthranilate isomerase [Planctomycetota bacterium]